MLIGSHRSNCTEHVHIHNRAGSPDPARHQDLQPQSPRSSDNKLVHARTSLPRFAQL
ncbi:MAG: hypothetical protein HC795_16195 [Coleofasciculaceae cyanobacterium RL_1_1]|nr:hypothetical protein [Coleofasciculaceae cyanobacterium RL_1_1]